MRAMQKYCRGLMLFGVFLFPAEPASAGDPIAQIKWLLLHMPKPAVLERYLERLGIVKTAAVTSRYSARTLSIARDTALLKRAAERQRETTRPLMASRARPDLAARPELQRLLRQLEADPQLSTALKSIGRRPAPQLQTFQAEAATAAKEKAPLIDIGVFDGRVKIGELGRWRNVAFHGGEFNAFKWAIPGAAAIYCGTSACLSTLSRQIRGDTVDLKELRELIGKAQQAAQSRSATPALPSGAPPNRPR